MSLVDEVNKIPPVTRSLALGTIAVSIPCMIGIASPYKVIFVPSLVTQQWQLWRVFTSFLYGGDGLSFLFSLIMLYRHSNSLEEQHFHRATADYAYAILLMGLSILALNLKLGGMIFFKPLLTAIIYLEAQANPNATISLYGFINMQSFWFPWAMLALDLLMGGTQLAMQSLTGIMAAHGYWYLTQVYPRSHGGRTLLSTPELLKQWLGNGDISVAGGGVRLGSAGVSAFAPRQQQQQQPQSSGSLRNRAASAVSGGHSWGSGHRLGN